MQSYPSLYPTQQFPFGMAFVCQTGNFWTLLRTMCLLGSRIMASFTDFPCSSQRLPSNGGECMFISKFTCHLSF